MSYHLSLNAEDRIRFEDALGDTLDPFDDDLFAGMLRCRCGAAIERSGACDLCEAERLAFAEAQRREDRETRNRQHARDLRAAA